MLAVYCVSHVPALPMLQIPSYEGENAKLLLYLIVVVRFSDVLQYVFGKTLGKRRIARRVGPNKAREGAIGGITAAGLIGALLWWAPPQPWESAGIAIFINLAGFAGGLWLSANKRDRGIKDFGSLIPGHGGIRDRIDSLCFAAPIFSIWCGTAIPEGRVANREGLEAEGLVMACVVSRRAGLASPLAPLARCYSLAVSLYPSPPGGHPWLRRRS
jgi:predicted CDP-diglyceride synthetase/phosphatidate cytidylyltransferase